MNAYSTGRTNWRRKYLSTLQLLFLLLFLLSSGFLVFSLYAWSKDTTPKSKNYLNEQKICPASEKPLIGSSAKSEKLKNN